MSEKDVWMKIGQLEAAIAAMHGRQDRTENDIKTQLSAMNQNLDDLKQFMNRSHGWWDAGKLVWGIGGLIGGSGLLAMAKFMITGSL